MCFDPVTAAVMFVVTTATAGVTQYMQNRAANQTAELEYDYQKKMAKKSIEATKTQLSEKLSRQNLQAARQAGQAFTEAQQQILENMRRQATATANAGSQGISGLALSQLFNDYQVSVGNVATNLETKYTQLNENVFFNTQDMKLQAQSQVNQAIPAPPILQGFSLVPALMSGLAAGVGAGLTAGSANPKAPRPDRNPDPGTPGGPPLPSPGDPGRIPAE